MTIELDYVLAPQVIDPNVAFSTLDETSLRYDYFLGDIRGCVGNLKLATRWGWVPIIDFALSLAHLSRELNRNSAQRFEFTESGDWIDFSIESDCVIVTASYTEGTGRVELGEFQASVSKFASRVVSELSNRAPGLEANPAVVGSLQ